LLEDIRTVLGDRIISVSRELTKLYEETWRGEVNEALGYFEEGRVRGEITIVISGASQEASRWDEVAVQTAMNELMDEGISRKDAASKVAERSGWKRRDVYNLSLSKN
jgi:16S rRNA (cytidine1402-2'-O)-methyltransferase